MSQSVALLAALFVTLAGPAAAQVAILQIQFVEGEGGVHAPGSRATRPLTVAVTDETGKPVAGAAVSFHLPEDGPSGVFGNGLRTQVALTDQQGRVSVHGLQVNRIAGRFQIRVVASKEQARAGVVSFQYVAEPHRGAAAAPAATVRRHSRWLLVAVLAGGGAAAGILSARHPAAASTPTAASPVAAAVTAPPFSIGAPTTTVGKP